MPMCFFFNTPKGCLRTRCRFLHSTPSLPPPPPPPPPNHPFGLVFDRISNILNADSPAAQIRYSGWCKAFPDFQNAPPLKLGAQTAPRRVSTQATLPSASNMTTEFTLSNFHDAPVQLDFRAKQKHFSHQQPDHSNFDTFER